MGFKLNTLANKTKGQLRKQPCEPSASLFWLKTGSCNKTECQLGHKYGALGQGWDGLVERYELGHPALVTIIDQSEQKLSESTNFDHFIGASKAEHRQQS